MKKFLAILLSFVIVLGCFTACSNEEKPVTNPTAAPTTEPTAEPTEEPTEEPTAEPDSDIAGISRTLVYPENNTEFSLDFAKQVFFLNLATGKDGFVTLANYFGFNTLLAEGHFNKNPTDNSHTAGYVVLSGKTTYKGAARNVVLIVVSATQTGEWASNVDIAPSHDNDTLYAENFYMAAEDIFNNTKDIINKVENPLILTTGYSRGAAVSNLLGIMLNNEFGLENCFTYTFATPTTIRSEEANQNSSNIFNIINQSDIVTTLPPSSFGYYRAGTDYYVLGNEAVKKGLDDAKETIKTCVPDIKTYYDSKYSLEAAGIDEENGKTVYDIMKEVVKLLDTTGEQDTSGLLEYMLMSEESDLYPVMSTILLVMAGDGDYELADLYSQHFPTTYGPLIDIDIDAAKTLLTSLGLSISEPNVDDLLNF